MDWTKTCVCQRARDEADEPRRKPGKPTSAASWPWLKPGDDYIHHIQQHQQQNHLLCSTDQVKKGSTAQRHFYISFFQQILGSGQNLMGEYGGQEKGILKKSGPAGYCPAMDKDR